MRLCVTFPPTLQLLPLLRNALDVHKDRDGGSSILISRIISKLIGDLKADCECPSPTSSIELSPAAEKRKNRKRERKQIAEIDSIGTMLLNSICDEITAEIVRESIYERIPPWLCCSITHKVFRYPVMATDNHTYERSAIEALLEHSNVSPLTGEVISKKLTFDQVKYNCVAMLNAQTHV